MFQRRLIRLLCGQSPVDGTLWATFETECGARFVFWGSPQLGNVNVSRLKNQPLPVLIQVEENLDNCLASVSVKLRYKCCFSVSEEICITVLSDDADI
jgi:hypothetical protein